LRRVDRVAEGSPGYLETIRQAVAEVPQPSADPVTTERDLRRASLRTERLSLAADAFAAERDLERLASCIARHACELLDADYACVRLYALQRTDVRAASRGRTPSPVETWPLVERLVQRARAEHRPQVDRIGDPSVHDGLCAVLVVPIHGLHRRVIGTIEWVNRKITPFFEPDDAAAAVCLARIASTAIDRARLFGHLHEWSQSLEMLLSFNAAVNRRLEPRKLVRQLLENAIRFLKAEGGVVGLAVDVPEDGTVRMQCEGRWLRGEWSDWPRQWKAKEGIPGFVLVSEFPYFAADYANDPLADVELVESHGVARSLCVPIKNAREQVLGFFELHRDADDLDFTWQDAAFLESLGNTAAVAIENARLLKSLEARNREIKRLSAEHVQRLEEERRHISRELHDEAGQALIGLKLGIQVLSALLPTGADEAHHYLQQLRAQLNESAARIKDLATRLRPPALDELGFEAAIRQLAVDCRERLGLDIALQFESHADLPSGLATSLYRIVQEALTNVSKHAGVDACRVIFRVDEDAVLTIEDQGRGFDTSSPPEGLGLLGMKERVKMLGGRIDISSKLGRGTRVTARIPYHAQTQDPPRGRP